MGKYTFLRVEADSAVVKRVLGLLPGVEAVDTLDGDRGDTPPAPSPEAPSDGTVEDDLSDDSGLAGSLPGDDVLNEESAVSKYGLLGVGVSFVVLGIATVGIWWYRRRSGEESVSAETPPPAAEFDATDEPSPPAPTELGNESTDEETTDDESTDDTATELNLVLDREEAETEADAVDDDAEESASEPASRGDERGDGEDVEWAPKWSGSPPEPSADTAEDSTEDETAEPTAGESVDAAPLLGIAFIAVTGAIVRWARGDSDADQT